MSTKFYFETLKGLWGEYRNGDCSFWTFLDCALPTPVGIAMDRITHPVESWKKEKALRKELKWCKSIKVGSVVCTCRNKHATVAKKLDDTTVIDYDGFQHDLIACCCEPEDDLTCHMPPLMGFMERYGIVKIELEREPMDAVLWFEGLKEPFGIQEFLNSDLTSTKTYDEFYKALWGN